MRFLFCGLALSFAPVALAAAGEKPALLSLGILPAYDASGEFPATTLARALPNLIFERLRGSRVDPVFLNPGGGYSPLEGSGIWSTPGRPRWMRSW